MSADQTPEPIGEKIFEAALDVLDEGEELCAEVLAAQFPGREAEIESALDAVGRYRECVDKERELLGRTAMGGLLAQGDELGDFVVDSLLGKGGMGEVYRARQRSLGDRAVALKVLPPALVARDPRFVERFRREASLASAVHHAGIAEVYGSGAGDGLLHFAMRLVEGRTLSDVLEGLARLRRTGRSPMSEPGNIRRAVRLTCNIAQALEAIHARGLVHRDVKPSNVILEGASHGRMAALECPPVLIDFGLLRPVEGSEITGQETLLGTPAFSSPEAQLHRDVGPQADVFSLGVMLYDLLGQTVAGERPAASSGLADVRILNPAVDRRLAAIVRMALEDSPALRYRDGAALARELESYLRGDSLAALPTGVLRRARLWARRDPLRAVKLTVLALIVIGGTLTVGAWSYRTRELYDLVKAARQCEKSGDLVGGAREYRELLSKAFGTSYLPGLEAAVERGHRYWPDGHEDGAPTAGVALVSIGGSPEDLARGQLWIQRALRDEHSPIEQEAIFRFLAFEILDTSLSLERRHAAAESLAHFFLLYPVGRDGSPKESVQLSELRRALIETVVDSGEQAELRSVAASALSGLRAHDSFEALITVIEEAARMPATEYAPELVRIALAGSERIWWQFREEGLLGEVDQSLFVAWANAVHHQLEEHLEEANLWGTHLFEQICHAVALTRVLLEEEGTLDPEAWSLIDPIAEPLQDEIASLFEACRRGDEPPRLTLGPFPDGDNFCSPKPKARMAFYVARWKGVEGEWRNFSDLLRSGPDLSRIEVHEQPEPKFTLHPGNGWISVASGTLGVETEYLSLENHSGIPTPPHEDPQVLQFNRVQASVLRVRYRIPEGNLSARITLHGAKAARFVLPDMGRACIEARIVGGRRLSEGDASLGRAPLEFWVLKDELAAMDELAIEIRLIDGTTTYWLYGLDVRFEPLPE
jgi:serine/threonine protein kinase